jgi:hypothetical protein
VSAICKPLDISMISQNSEVKKSNNSPNPYFSHLENKYGRGYSASKE